MCGGSGEPTDGELETLGLLFSAWAVPSRVRNTVAV